MIKQKEKFWKILLISAIIAAAISFLTTSFGLSYYLSLLFAIPLALAVQMGLFGLAWLIGFGNKGIKPLIIGLYFMTMIFSVIFSYVFLQSELVEKIKPRETQRELVDLMRSRIISFENIINESISEAESLSNRLTIWHETEGARGWSTKTCQGVSQCYLLDVCKRIRSKIEEWEKITGKPYREGPGKQLIYGALGEEARAIDLVVKRLGEYRENVWMKSNVLNETMQNRERLLAYDRLIASIPVKDLKAILCRNIKLDLSIPYEKYARDNVIRDEKQVYAFDDLRKVFSRDYQIKRGDYPTIFALGLAIFIDLFVLLVAIGAALIEQKKADNSEGDQKIPVRDQSEINSNVDDFISKALMGKASSEEEKREFARELIESIQARGEGENILIPLNKEQFRFGIILEKFKASKIISRKIKKEKTTVFSLNDWIYQALLNYINPKNLKDNSD